jgi:putative ABC transport system substrate-binding protein
MKVAAAGVRSVIAGIALGFALMAGFASADQPAKIPRIGVLFPADVGSPMEQGLRQGLRDHGYSEGVNIVIEWRRSAETTQELKALATDLTRSGVDLMVVFTTPAARAALEVTTVPVVVLAGDPVAAGLAASLARPAGNSTGVSLMTTELTAKRLELLHQMAPRARRILVLVNTSNQTALPQLDEAKRGAGVLGLQLVPSDARNAAELDAALRRVNRGSADAVLVTGDLFLMSNRAKIAGAVRGARLPAIYPNRHYHDEGALISYGPDVKEAARRLASFVDRILKGAKPGDLPFEQVAKFELVVNLKTAKALGITIPQSILLQADEVIR